ncbi:hypothetical protein BT69DRAFT_315595 [Atractiella rhizophila]|nr:hypothetical protein BT69DRAFT_315595 [Atractiella rhizophila]
MSMGRTWTSDSGEGRYDKGSIINMVCFAPARHPPPSYAFPVFHAVLPHISLKEMHARLTAYPNAGRLRTCLSFKIDDDISVEMVKDVIAGLPNVTEVEMNALSRILCGGRKLRRRLAKKDVRFRSLGDLLSEPEATQAVWEFIRRSGKFKLWITRAQRVLDRRKAKRKHTAESRGEKDDSREDWED